jgi:hypothetical protein
MPTSAPTSTPVFASDEEALAAATAAYAEYQAVVDRALSDYDTGGLDKVATGDALAAAQDSIGVFKTKDRKLVGTSTIDSVSIAQAPLTGTPVEMQIYACLDVSATDVIDSTGKSVVDPSRRSRLPMVVSLNSKSGNSKLLVSLADVWDGNDFC